MVDDYTTYPYRTMRSERDQANRQLQDAREGLRQTTVELVRWREAALSAWADAAATALGSDDELETLRSEIEAIRETVSWRVTKPLRTVRERLGSSQNGR